MLYNGKPFKLGMTIRELIDIFGPYDFFNRGYYAWKDVGIVAAWKVGGIENIEEKAKIFDIYLEDDYEKNYVDKKNVMKHRSVVKSDYFLIEGMPIVKNISFIDFESNSRFTLGDFSVGNNSYELYYSCDASARRLVYYLDVEGAWIYKGAGHLMMKSHPNSKNINKIKAIEVFVSND